MTKTHDTLPPEIQSITFSRRTGPNGSAYVYTTRLPLTLAPGSRVALKISLHAYGSRHRVTKRELSAAIRRLSFTPLKGALK